MVDLRFVDIVDNNCKYISGSEFDTFCCYSHGFVIILYRYEYCIGFCFFIKPTLGFSANNVAIVGETLNCRLIVLIPDKLIFQFRFKTVQAISFSSSLKACICSVVLRASDVAPTKANCPSS